MYQKNDIVMYNTQGVCKITDIIMKDFGGEQIQYYVLKPVASETAVIYIPVDNEQLTGKMCHVLTADEIYEIIRSLTQEESTWIENEQERKEEYKRIMAQGDRKALITMIKTLYLHKQNLKLQGRKLHVADERFFKEAEKILYDEFALVLHIDAEQVVPFIMEQIENAEAEQKNS